MERRLLCSGGLAGFRMHVTVDDTRLDGFKALLEAWEGAGEHRRKGVLDVLHRLYTVAFSHWSG